jgi:DNA polymerase
MAKREKSEAEPVDEPGAELAELAGALEAHTRRRRALGVRRSSKPAARRAGGPRASGAPARSADDVKEQAAACATLDELREAVARCEACGLCKTRTQTVFMDGEGSSGVLFVGEAPGADEDRTGVPFVGRAGQLLTDIITKGMGLPRSAVRIANVLKCRPPENREPTGPEKETCTPWLDRQIELTAPKVIVPLGRHAAMHMLKVVASMGTMRGRVHERDGQKIIPTFHPAYLLRSPGEKKECWKDIQLVMKEIGLPRTSGNP